jgi:methylglyoxal synthase
MQIACNRSTADFLITSRLFREAYQPRVAPALGGDGDGE